MLIMHIIFFLIHRCMKIVVAMVTEIVKYYINIWILR